MFETYGSRIAIARKPAASCRHAAVLGAGVDRGRRRLPGPGADRGAGLRRGWPVLQALPGERGEAVDAAGHFPRLAGLGGGPGQADFVEVAGPSRARGARSATRLRQSPGAVQVSSAGHDGQVAGEDPGGVTAANREERGVRGGTVAAVSGGAETGGRIARTGHSQDVLDRRGAPCFDAVWDGCGSRKGSSRGRLMAVPGTLAVLPLIERTI